MLVASLPTQRNLFACHKNILKGCAAENKAFMMCKAENEDPRACAEFGCAALSAAMSALHQPDVLSTSARPDPCTNSPVARMVPQCGGDVVHHGGVSGAHLSSLAIRNWN